MPRLSRTTIGRLLLAAAVLVALMGLVTAPVLVEGELNADPDTGGPRIWKGNDGEPRASYELTARTVRFLGGRGEATPAGPTGGEIDGPPAKEDQEIPF